MAYKTSLLLGTSLLSGIGLAVALEVFMAEPTPQNIQQSMDNNISTITAIPSKVAATSVAIPMMTQGGVTVTTTATATGVTSTSVAAGGSVAGSAAIGSSAVAAGSATAGTAIAAGTATVAASSTAVVAGAAVATGGVAAASTLVVATAATAAIAATSAIVKAVTEDDNGNKSDIPVSPSSNN